MSKEEILELLKTQILMLRDHQVKHKMIQENIQKLNSCDALWLQDEYGKWFEKEIRPSMKKPS